jgi:hypothetical protein
MLPAWPLPPPIAMDKCLIPLVSFLTAAQSALASVVKLTVPVVKLTTRWDALVAQ